MSKYKGSCEVCNVMEFDERCTFIFSVDPKARDDIISCNGHFTMFISVSAEILTLNTGRSSHKNCFWVCQERSTIFLNHNSSTLPLEAIEYIKFEFVLHNAAAG